MGSSGFGDQPGPSDAPPPPPWPPGPYGQPGPFGPQAPYGPPGWIQPRRTNSLAIAALCCGIGQVIAGFLSGIPAIVLGYIALGQIRQTGEEGRGMAITGIVLGFISIVVTVIVIILIIAAWQHATSNPGY
jgi:uncharacterized protein DUF4190